MDTKYVTLGEHPETVTFETERGSISVEASPVDGPGLYEVALNVLWAEDAT